MKRAAEIERIALGIDIRGGRLFEDFFKGLAELHSNGFEYEILFLDASDSALIKRFKETRRVHPLSKGDSIAIGIGKEREILENIKAKSDYIIDTTNVLTRELKEQIVKIFVDDHGFREPDDYGLLIRVQIRDTARIPTWYWTSGSCPTLFISRSSRSLRGTTRRSGTMSCPSRKAACFWTSFRSFWNSLSPITSGKGKTSLS